MKINEIIQILKSCGYTEAKNGNEYRRKSYFQNYCDDKLKLIWSNEDGGDCWLWFAENTEKVIGGVNY